MTPALRDADVPRHPIAVVAQRTGLSQDLLRVWERRYAAVTPRRAGSRRRYSDSDIARLTLLHAATRAGRGIGQVAQLSDTALEALVAEDERARERLAARLSPPAPATPVAETTRILDESLAFARALDAVGLDDLLRRAAARIGVAGFLETIAAPLLRLVGAEWHAGRLSPAQEHLVSSVVHAIAAETLRSFATPGAPRMLVTTPAGDRHAIGAAIVGAAAAAEGWNVLYLGADLPAGEIADAARTSGARVVALSVVYVDGRQRVLDELRALRAALPAPLPLLVGGTGAGELGPELAAAGVRVESSIPGLLAQLQHELARA